MGPRAASATGRLPRVPRRRRATIVALLVLAVVAAACGSRLPEDVLGQIDAAALRDASSEQASSPTSVADDGAPVDDGASPVVNDTVDEGPAGGGTAPASDGASATTQPAGAGDAPCSGGATDTGVTADEVKIASIVTASGPLPGATEGAYRGAAAYVAKTNAEGGVCGRKITLLRGDDGLDPQRARGEFLRLEPEVLAFVGSFAVADSGYVDLIEETGVPYAGTSVDPAGRTLPNVVPHVEEGVAHSGPYEYYRRTYPDAGDMGFLYADVGGVKANTPGIIKGWQEAGFTIVYNSGFSATQVDFTPDVINLRQSGAKLVYLFAFEVNMHVRLARNMRQQNYEPPVKVSNIGYNSKLIELLGGIADGWSNHLTYLPMLNEAEPARSPALAEFLTWYNRVSPGASIDLFPVTAWGDAARFVEALRQAGGDVTREKIIEIIDNLPTDDGGGIFAPTKPAQRQGADCFVIVRVEDGEWVREHPDSGYECGLGDFYRF